MTMPIGRRCWPRRAPTRFVHAQPVACLPDITNLFRFREVEALLAIAGDGRHDLPYEDVAAQGAKGDCPWRRLVQGDRVLYRRNRLDGLLPAGHVAIPGAARRNLQTGLHARSYRFCFQTSGRAGRCLERAIARSAMVLGRKGRKAAVLLTSTAIITGGSHQGGFQPFSGLQ